MKEHSLFNDGINEYKSIKFKLTRRNKRSLTMKINSKNEIDVSIPSYARDNLIIEFLDKNLERFSSILLEKTKNHWYNKEEKWFYLFGEKKYFEIDEQKNKIVLDDFTKISLNNSFEESINAFRKKKLKNLLMSQQMEYEKRMSVDHHEIKIRKKESAWATNYVQKKVIFYSINLSSFSIDIINYVIVHELSHSKYPDHSKKFWSLVEKYESNYKEKRKKLKKTIYH